MVNVGVATVLTYVDDLLEVLESSGIALQGFRGKAPDVETGDELLSL